MFSPRKKTANVLIISHAEEDIMARKVAASEILQHNKRGDVWIVVEREVYDITQFAPEHPGGQESTFQPSTALGNGVSTLDTLCSRAFSYI